MLTERYVPPRRTATVSFPRQFQIYRLGNIANVTLTGPIQRSKRLKASHATKRPGYFSHRILRGCSDDEGPRTGTVSVRMSDSMSSLRQPDSSVSDHD
jgi:hypothetical protein